MRELRLAIRRLRRNLTLTTAVVITLAASIGINVAIFSVINAVLLRPLPFQDPDRLVALWEHNLTQDQHLSEVSFSNFRDWRARNRTFEDMAAMGSTNWSYDLVGGDGPYRAYYRAVSTSFFETLGVNAALGRTFLPQEDEPDSNRVVVLSHGLWQRRFGADPTILDQAIAIKTENGTQLFTIIGVMPTDFRFPIGAELWTPVGRELAEISRKHSFDAVETRQLGVLLVVGKLKPNLTLEQGTTDLTAIVRQLAEEYATSGAQGVSISPLLDHIFGRTRPALYALWGAVGLVLLLACTNAAGLLLARAATRQKEFSVQRALGASGGRILRQIMTEVGVIAFAGGFGAVLLATGALQALVGISPVEVPRLEQVSIDGQALAFTIGLSILTTIFVGLVTAMQVTKPALTIALNESTRSATTAYQSSRAWKLLVTTQVAIALVLLVGAGLMVRSFLNLTSTDLGFDPTNVLTVQLDLPEDRYPTTRARQELYRHLLERIETSPNIVAAGAIRHRPFLHGSIGDDWRFLIEGQNDETNSFEQNPTVNALVATPGYFRAMGIRLLQGRIFGERDIDTAEPVVILSKSLAEKAFPGKNPIGQRLRVGGWRDTAENPPWSTVIGVVGNARYREVETTRFDLYQPYLQSSSVPSGIIIRTDSDPVVLAPLIQQEVRSLDRGILITEITTMDQVVYRMFAPWRFNMLLFSVFGVLALASAATALFGVLAYGVSQRKQEIGVRIALGAMAGDIFKLVVGRGMSLTITGLAIGMVLTLALSHFVSSLMFEIEVTDWSTYLGIAVLLTSVAFLACYIPARRASKVDPIVAIRYE